MKLQFGARCFKQFFIDWGSVDTTYKVLEVEGFDVVI